MQPSELKTSEQWLYRVILSSGVGDVIVLHYNINQILHEYIFKTTQIITNQWPK